MYHLASYAMPEVGTLHCPIPPMVNTVLETCHSHSPTPILSVEVYTYPYMHPPMVPSPLVVQAEVNSRTLFAQSVPV